MTSTLLLITGLVAGGLIGYLAARLKNQNALQDERIHADELVRIHEQKLAELRSQADKADAARQWMETSLQDCRTEQEQYKAKLENARQETAIAQAECSAKDERLRATEKLTARLAERETDITRLNAEIAQRSAQYKVLQERLEQGQQEVAELRRRFQVEFENTAGKLLKTNSEQFAQSSRQSLLTLLDPLKQKLEEFTLRVKTCYDAEAKERFSLEKEVKALATLNTRLSDEAQRLTNALKGESKTQGCWGEMILETILERSGLTRDREYFMEQELKDEHGTTLRAEETGKKMRPDAIVVYPDHRRIIIDSKVSLTAYLRFAEATEEDDRRQAVKEHILSVRKHVDELSTKAYDDYDKTLDFVMMFIPNEAAYNTAMQYDAELWNYAYSKRILLISPTNLIVSLKLIHNLWQRDTQNRNTQAIADQGAKLYDKFVGFVTTVQEVGKAISKASTTYEKAQKQLYSGNGNIMAQAEKLRNLGIKNKKSLSPDLVELAQTEDSLPTLEDAPE